MNSTKCIYGYKVLLCFLVVSGHMYNFIGGRYIWGIPMLGGIGARAVDGFFLITAFLTMLSYEKRPCNSKKFIIKRFWRLYPVYIVCLLLAYITEPIRTGIQEKILFYLTGNNIGAWGMSYVKEPFASVNDFLQHVFLIHGIFDKTSETTILGTFWTMSVEWIYYVFFALFVIILLKKNNKCNKWFTRLFMISIASGLVIYVLNFKEDPQRNFIRCLPIFFYGMIMATKSYEKKKELYLLGVILCIYLMVLDKSQNWVSCGIIMFMTVLLFEKNKVLEMFHKILSCSLMEYLCKRSYVVYLTHTIVMPFCFFCGYKISKLFYHNLLLFFFVSILIFLITMAIISQILYLFVEAKFPMKVSNK